MHMRHAHIPCPMPHVNTKTKTYTAHAHIPAYTFGSGTGFRHSEKDPVCRARESGHSTRMCQANHNPNKQWPVIDADSESPAVVYRHRNVHGEWPDACFFCSHGCLCGVFVTTPGPTAVRRERDRDQRVLPPPLRTLLFDFLLYVDFGWAFMWLGRIAAAEGWRSLLSLVWIVRWFLVEEANQVGNLIFRHCCFSFVRLKKRCEGQVVWLGLGASCLSIWNRCLGQP